MSLLAYNVKPYFFEITGIYHDLQILLEYCFYFLNKALKIRFSEDEYECAIATTAAFPVAGRVKSVYPGGTQNALYHIAAIFRPRQNQIFQTLL